MAVAATGRRRGAARRVGDVAPPAVAAVLVLVGWEFGLAALGVQQFLLPRPTTILRSLGEEWDVLGRGVLYTGGEALAGFVVGCAAGILAAFATARWVVAREALMPVAIAANSIPIIAFAPIAGAWFGSQNPMARVAIVTLLVFFPVMVNTVRGLTFVETETLELMKSYAANDSQILRQVRIPNALPFVFTALRVAATLAVIGAVIGEYFGGPRYSLGVFISSEAYVFRYPNAWAAIVLACVIGIAFYGAVALTERIAIPWARLRLQAS